MGNTNSSLQDKLFLYARQGKYDDLASLLEQLISNSSEFRRNPSPFLDIKDSEGNTPLLTACIKGHYHVVEVLLRYRASTQVQNSRINGGTPLHEAIYRRRQDIIDILLRYGADPFVQNIKQFTAMDIACVQKNVDLIRRLESYSNWKGWLEVKVPIVLGLSTEWKRRWCVILPRKPSPWAAPNKQRTHIALLFYKSMNASTPDVKVWLDGASAVEVANAGALQHSNGNLPAQIELHLHQSHRCPDGVYVSGNSMYGYRLHLRPDEGSMRGCQDLASFAVVVNMRGRGSAPNPNAPTPVPAAVVQQHHTPPPPIVPHPNISNNNNGNRNNNNDWMHSESSSDAELARRLQVEEDENLARMISSSLPPAPTRLENDRSSEGLTLSMRPSAPPLSEASPPPLPPAAPPQPPKSLPNVTRITSMSNDKGLCCICMDSRATHGFLHGELVHLNCCGDCADGLSSAGNATQCPTCRQRAKVVRIIAQTT